MCFLKRSKNVRQLVKYLEIATCTNICAMKEKCDKAQYRR